MKITILDGYLVNHGDLSWEELSNFGELVVYDFTSPDKIAERIQDSDVVFTNRSVLTEKHFAQCPNLKLIGTFGTGFNYVDIDAAKRHHILVCNAPGYSTYAVAQAAISLLLEITNKVSFFNQYVHEQHWRESVDPNLVTVPQIELVGKTFGVIGLGEIGRQTAMIAHALGMNIIAYRPSGTPESQGSPIQLCPLSEVLENSDIISLHCPLNAQTENLIQEQTLSTVKQGAILLNTARGKLVDSYAVARALDVGKLYAYGTDVLSEEPPLPNNPLVNHPRVVITPHMAWHPKETRQRLIDICAENLSCFLAGDPIHVVNP